MLDSKPVIKEITKRKRNLGIVKVLKVSVKMTMIY